jgi:transcriptional regulator with XRE-family HTH domain
MKLKKALSQRIKSLREIAGLSQQDVATRGDLSLSLVAKLEQGKKADPRASTILALADALGVKPGQLLDDLFPPAEPEKPAEAEPAANGHAAEAKKDGKKKKVAKKKKPE